MKGLNEYLIPEDMEQYLSYYGCHFNKLLCEFAVSKMKRDDKQTGMLKKNNSYYNGRVESIT